MTMTRKSTKTRQRIKEDYCETFSASKRFSRNLQLDMGDTVIEAAAAHVAEENELNEKQIAFCTELMHGWAEHKDEIDEAD